MVHTKVGHTSHCRQPVGWQGPYVNSTGKWWMVWSCKEHQEGLEDRVAAGPRRSERADTEGDQFS